MVDKASNIQKLQPLDIEVISPDDAKEQFRKIIDALPSGPSEVPAKALLAGQKVVIIHQCLAYRYELSYATQLPIL